jgi:hypothetical protein
MKRTVQVNLKMTQEDFQMLKKTANEALARCRDNQGIVLALAKIAGNGGWGLSPSGSPLLRFAV